MKALVKFTLLPKNQDPHARSLDYDSSKLKLNKSSDDINRYPAYFRMLQKMPTGIDVLMSMGCLWADAFIIAIITVIVKMNVSLSSKVVLKIVPVRWVKRYFTHNV